MPLGMANSGQSESKTRVRAEANAAVARKQERTLITMSGGEGNVGRFTPLSESGRRIEAAGSGCVSFKVIIIMAPEFSACAGGGN